MLKFPWKKHVSNGFSPNLALSHPQPSVAGTGMSWIQLLGPPFPFQPQFPAGFGSMLLPKRPLDFCILQIQCFWEYEGSGNVESSRSGIFGNGRDLGMFASFKHVVFGNTRFKGDHAQISLEKNVFPMDFPRIWPFPILSQALLGLG